MLNWLRRSTAPLKAFTVIPGGRGTHNASKGLGMEARFNYDSIVRYDESQLMTLINEKALEGYRLVSVISIGAEGRLVAFMEREVPADA